MSDDLPSLRGKLSKKLNKLVKIPLVVAMWLFFLVFFGVVNSSFAEAPDSKNSLKAYSSIDFGKFDPLEEIKKRVVIIKKENKQRERPEEREGNVDALNSFMEKKYYNLVIGHPIEVMLPYIARCDLSVASFLIAIAKKESDWGEHAPRKANRDCYNYWGYRGTYNQTDSGYSCFDSPQQAIETVGNRIQALIKKKIDTPQKMIIWKCGSSCDGHDPMGVKKWISDVALYYDKLNS